MEKKYINIKDAAKMLGVSKLTLRNWDSAGKLNAYRHPLNNYRVYLVEDLEKILRKIESGERPVPRPKHTKNDSNSYRKIKVIHR